MTTTRRFTLDGTQRRHPAVEAWFTAPPGNLHAIARHWFDVMRSCGPDVTEVLHDGQPTACIGNAAFAYVDAFKDHVNVGFFPGSQLRDPAGLLEGTGKYMRHVKVRPGAPLDDAALRELITAAYHLVKGQL
jgi:hypothetical protein